MKPRCGYSDCTRLHYAKGLCRAHYARNKRTGTPGTSAIGPSIQRKARGKCTLKSRINPNYALGLCQTHYNLKRMMESGPTPELTCAMPGCRLRHTAKGLCYFHYMATRAAAASIEAEACGAGSKQ